MTDTKTIQQKIIEFEGTTFSSHADVVKWLSQALQEAQQEGSAYKGKAVREAYTKGYREAYKKALEDFWNEIELLEESKENFQYAEATRDFKSYALHTKMALSPEQTPEEKPSEILKSKLEKIESTEDIPGLTSPKEQTSEERECKNPDCITAPKPHEHCTIAHSGGEVEIKF